MDPSSKTTETVGTGFCCFMLSLLLLRFGFMLVIEPIQCVENLAKVQVFDPSYEADNVTVLPAAVAVKSAGRRIDRERGNPVLVKWTEADEIHARGPQLNVLADYLNDGM